MSPLESMDWKQKLDEQETAANLGRLLDRAGDLARILDLFTSAQSAVNNVVATATDYADEQCRQTADRGVDLESRFQQVTDLVEKATRPEVLQAIGKLLDRLPQLVSLVEQVPDLVAMLADVADEFARKSSAAGLDLEKSLTNGLRTMLWLGQQISEEELDRLGTLLKSDMLAPTAIEVVANAASSLCVSQSATCDPCQTSRVGLFGLFRALRNEDFQRALGFAVHFGKCFGANLDRKNRG